MASSCREGLVVQILSFHTSSRLLSDERTASVVVVAHHAQETSTSRSENRFDEITTDAVESQCPATDLDFHAGQETDYGNTRGASNLESAAPRFRPEDLPVRSYREHLSSHHTEHGSVTYHIQHHGRSRDDKPRQA